MRKIFALLLIATPLAGCVQDSGGNAARRPVGGAAAGALVADVTGGSKTKGALIGALIGGVSCGVPGLPSC
ncbi:MAG: hypothetical protein ACO22Z_12550 [Paracoccaceae bacterium]